MAAPIAHFDEDGPGESELSRPQRRLVAPGTGHSSPPGDAELEDELPDGNLSSPGDSGAFRSMEDLVKDFDERLSACFQNYDAQTESIAPVSAPREDTLLPPGETWTALPQSHSQVTTGDWRQSLTPFLPTSAPAPFSEDPPCEKEISDDEEELREQLHSTIISSITDEPLLTADQVIEEIEEMMLESPDAAHNPSQSDLSMLSVDVLRIATSPRCRDRIRGLTVAELSERLRETECSIRRLSEELVQQLALRDEQDYEKEVKNSFISALIEVQNRQKEHRESLKKKKKLKGAAGTSNGLTERTLAARFSMEGISSVIQNSFRQTFRGGCTEKQYLTTVIPYAKTGHAPAIQDLQVLTRILVAMKDDSDKVPGLLTDYILKVLCPT